MGVTARPLSKCASKLIDLESGRRKNAQTSFQMCLKMIDLESGLCVF